jgi:mono/diheme cytochrome c family protein
MIGLRYVAGAAGAALVIGAAAVERPAVAADASDLAFEVAAAAQDTAGKAIFTGKGICYACHGANAKGTPLAPDLTDGKWINVDGSVASIARVVKEGVPAPKEHPAPMPPMGGAQLTDAEIQAVAQYVFSLNPRG